MLALVFVALPGLVFGQEIPDMTRGVVDAHILPRFENLAQQSKHLANTAHADCRTKSPQLRTAYTKAFDAWLATAHLRFGPTEVNNRGFALAFWPDRRGTTPKALAALIKTQDPIIQTAKAYAEVSVAARGFYALEFLIYDPADRHCQKVTETFELADDCVRLRSGHRGPYRRSYSKITLSHLGVHKVFW